MAAASTASWNCGGSCRLARPAASVARTAYGISFQYITRTWAMGPLLWHDRRTGPAVLRRRIDHETSRDAARRPAGAHDACARARPGADDHDPVPVLPARRQEPLPAEMLRPLPLPHPPVRPRRGDVPPASRAAGSALHRLSGHGGELAGADGGLGRPDHRLGDLPRRRRVRPDGAAAARLKGR